ncbi:3'-5' exonuclease [Marinobacterium sediminicola]|uniref:DNA 3'-5' helicase n=1 Tax=Marinobacterium sediminicola TaxID=518898 RepID=A0ABY1S2W3_9GAMM|nr:3'-5' exonuclease [Marinobacterium sediminicola]ULG68814.1 UvrD-helicase domain-containing protein [Marinobacterium sediminicola]SMR77581.1 UvrD/REP helicase N-terminal domain-containing protein [Marinobacterium sediminicola]
MDQSVLETQVLKLLELHAPIKARKLAAILAEEFGKHVDRSDVNSILYRLKSEGKTVVDSNYQWRIGGQSVSTAGTAKRGKRVTAMEPAQPSIVFTPEQQAVIDLDPSMHLLIRGQAGSGKTTVLAARAGRILSAMNKGSLLFLTYNSALSAYVKRAFSQSGMKGDIDVRTFHDWARNAAKGLGFEFTGWVDGKVRSEQIKACIEKAKSEVGNHRLFDFQASPELLAWWGDEIAWLFGQHITHLDEYLAVERSGRGTAIRISQEDRRFVWCVFELYEEWLENTRQEDYDNPAGLILRALMERGGDLPDEYRYDHVMIDEVQDFDKSWLLIAAKIPRVSLSMAGDLAQKIYRRSFSWSSVGIQVQGGRSKRLAASHRTTRQIMDVAEYLLADNDVTQSPDFTSPDRPTKNGDKVKLLLADTPKHAYEQGYDWIAHKFKRLRSTSVAVVLPFSRQLFPAQKALEKRGVNVKRAKGAGLGNFGGGVVVTTFHQLKGLEFDHVVIMGLHDAQYPGRLLESMPQEDQGEEISLMRRVLYVAMTRAKQSVTLVGSAPFCRFFDEVPSEVMERV